MKEINAQQCQEWSTMGHNLQFSKGNRLSSKGLPLFSLFTSGCCLAWLRDSERLTALLHLGGTRITWKGREGLLLYQAKEKCTVPQSLILLTFFITSHPPLENGFLSRKRKKEKDFPSLSLLLFHHLWFRL